MSVLELLIIILLIAWFTGTAVFPIGSAIHILLLIVVVILVIRVVQGVKP